MVASSSRCSPARSYCARPSALVLPCGLRGATPPSMTSELPTRCTGKETRPGVYGSVSSRFMCSTGAMKSTGATPPIPASPDEVNELRSEEKRSRFPQSRSRSTAALAGLGSALFGLSGALFTLTPGESMLSGVAAAACSTNVTEDGATLGGWIGLYRPSLFSSGCLFCCCCHCTDAKGPTCAIRARDQGRARVDVQTPTR